MGFSIVVSEPFLGMTEIMEFTLVAKIPKESTEKLKDKNKGQFKSLWGTHDTREEIDC